MTEIAVRRPLPRPLSRQARGVRKQVADDCFPQSDLQFSPSRFDGKPSSAVGLSTRILVAVALNASTPIAVARNARAPIAVGLNARIPRSRFQRERSFCPSPAAGEDGAAHFSLVDFARSVPHQVRAAHAARDYGILLFRWNSFFRFPFPREMSMSSDLLSLSILWRGRGVRAGVRLGKGLGVRSLRVEATSWAS